MTIKSVGHHVQSRLGHTSTSHFSAYEVHDRHVEETSTVTCPLVTEIDVLYTQRYEQPS